MSSRRLGIAIVALAIVGCDQKDPESAPPQPAAARQVDELPAVRLPTPPPARHALPLVVRDMRERAAEPAGKLYQPDIPDGIDLQAVGLNLCQGGYVLQAYFRGPDGKLQVTPPLPLPELVEGRDWEHRDPAIPGQAIVTRFEEASMTRLRGTLRIVKDPSLEQIVRLDLDAMPTGIPSGKGLGAQGCFTTGEFALTANGETIEGPVASVWDNKVTHWVRMQLDERHFVDFWLTLQPVQRQPGRMVRGDLARVLDEPKKFPFRVVFVERLAGESRETPAEVGTVTAAFQKASPEGPIRVEVRGLKFPDWDGPLANVTVDTLRAEALAVTDITGSQVPILVDATGKTTKPLVDDEGLDEGAAADSIQK